MANTRTATKRARQAVDRQKRNQMVRSAMRTSVKNVFDLLKTPESEKLQQAYQKAIRCLSQAATKGAIPKSRAARKTSRLTRLIQKQHAALQKAPVVSKTK